MEESKPAPALAGALSPQRSLLGLSRVLAGIVAAVAILVLIGWATGTELLITGVRGAIAMIPWTALTLLTASTSLWLQTNGDLSQSPTGRPQRVTSSIGYVLAFVVIVTGSVMLIQRLGNLDWRINSVFFGEELSRYPWRPTGLMATNSATCFVSIGIALLALRGVSRQSGLARELFGGFALLISLLAFLGHVYGVTNLYSLDGYAGMAPLTVLSFMLLSVGILAARPDAGIVSLLTGTNSSAVLTRRLLIVGVVVPAFLGRIWLGARRAELVSRELGVSLFVIGTMVVFAVAVLWSAKVMRRSEIIREEARERAERASRIAREAQAAAEKANRSKSEFLAVMSHELRTPLNAIRGYAEILDMNIAGPLTESQRDHLRKIQRSEAHLLGLIDDLLNYTQIETGRLSYAMRDIRLGSIVDQALVLTQPRAKAKNVSVESAIAEDSEIMVVGDHDKLVQIVVNLVSNAIKFSRPGSAVAIACAACNGDSIRNVALEVRDTGRGIPPDQLDHIFEPFFQVDKGLTRNNDGVGLGLAISLTLARAMSCEISAVSAPGEGSVFTLTIPSGSSLPGQAGS